MTDMRREVCVVEDIKEDIFIIKNTLDELYEIDISQLGEYKQGDYVLLTYSDRSLLKENVYKADIQTIYPFNNELKYPAK